MNREKGYEDKPSPDKFVHRDVSDLRIEFGRIDQQLANLKENSVNQLVFHISLRHLSELNLLNLSVAH